MRTPRYTGGPGKKLYMSSCVSQLLCIDLTELPIEYGVNDVIKIKTVALI